MQRQRELLQPFAQISEKTLGIGLVLKTSDSIVGVAHEHDILAGMLASPLKRGAGHKEGRSRIVCLRNLPALQRALMKWAIAKATSADSDGMKYRIEITEDPDA
jgi:hypothetical protein